MSLPHAIANLVDTFATHNEHYRSTAYNETELRREFVDPFFKSLGWDIDNSAGYADAYKDVIHEDAIKIGGTTKAPDYCFRIGGARKFFVEAKKPNVAIKDSALTAYQLRRYAWSAKLSLSILTNFAEFAIYDTRVKPDSGDKASNARVFYCTFKEYAEKWDEIAENFSREAVLRGSFDKFAENTRRKRGTAEVDDAFLEEIEQWRDMLARSFANRNPEISVRDLNFAVQATIDRMIFLRICEDRGTEDYGRLQSLLGETDTYKALGKLFVQADERYNSGLFHFKQEKENAEDVDSLTLDLALDDKAVKEIIRHLYYPESPYEFSVLPSDILGQIYERFLGKTISLTANHHARIEEKPEVRKAGGVYYTPTYVVEWIVQHTLGRLLNGSARNNGKQLSLADASNVRVLDPACGSGSFLLIAYQYLMDWHLARYREKADYYSKGANPRIYLSKSGDCRLTTHERKRILLNSIFGVDVDRQAVEVTKLSLLLKVLEGETEQIIQRDWVKERQRILPSLALNIRCGNSLIGPDFYDNEQMMLLDEDEQYRINVFDWRAAFPHQIDAGFDCVIGNPPYLYSAGQQYVDYFDRKYSLAEYQTDFYVYFSEKSLQLTKKGGFHSFIVSDSWLNSERISKFRGKVLSERLLSDIAVFDFTVFKDASIENSIYVATPGQKHSSISVARFLSPRRLASGSINPGRAIERGIIDPRSTEANVKIAEKMELRSVPLGELVHLNRGLHAYRTDGYGKSKFGRGVQTERDKEERSYHAPERRDDTYLPEVRGKDVCRYSWSSSGEYISYGDWLAEPRTPEFFFGNKIVLRKVLGSRLSGAFIGEPVAIDQSLYIAIPKNDRSVSLYYILGVLLSGVGAFYLRTKHSIYDRLFPWYTKKQLEMFPIHSIDFRKLDEVAAHDRVSALARRMTELSESYQEEKNPGTKAHVQTQIRITDRALESAVYALYGLSNDESGPLDIQTSDLGEVDPS